MFTGIITHQGTIGAIMPKGPGSTIRIDVPEGFMDGVDRGDSIAVSGVCLTAVDLLPNAFTVDVSLETLRRSTLGDRTTGARVNLERSLRLGDKMGGHLVMGHVDGVGHIDSIDPQGESSRYRFRMPAELAKYIAHKGSVAIDGISLTPTDATNETFDVWLIPETLRVTTLGEMGPGDAVNLEIDVLSRYVARQLGFANGVSDGVTMEQLAREGFLAQ